MLLRLAPIARYRVETRSQCSTGKRKRARECFYELYDNYFRGTYQKSCFIKAYHRRRRRGSARLSAAFNSVFFLPPPPLCLSPSRALFMLFAFSTGRTNECQCEFISGFGNTCAHFCTSRNCSSFGDGDTISARNRALTSARMTIFRR